MSARRFTCRDHRELAIWGAARGWKWAHANSGHIAWTNPDVLGTVFTSGTPSKSSWGVTRRKLEKAMRTGVAGKFMAAVIACPDGGRRAA